MAGNRPADWSDQSYYLRMRDGVRLAVSLYFPKHAVPAKPAPILLVQTRYGRAVARRSGEKRSLDPWLAAGYVVASVDVRGSTASFGARTSELSPAEQRDMEEIVHHLALEPWSSGQVVATGVSYTGNTADMATTRPAPALVAAVPRQTDFDFWELFWPGGIHNRFMFRDWVDGVYEIDFGRPRTRVGALVTAGQEGLDCRRRPEDCLRLFPTMQPADEDPTFALLAEALNGRERETRHWTSDDYADAPFRDDAGLNGCTLFESSAGAHLGALRRENKPVQYWGSWVDTITGEGSLNRHRSAPDLPSVVFITANNHGGDLRADPFLPERLDPVPSLAEQHCLHIEFANEVIAGRLPQRRIHYYVLGAGVMRETPVWPPQGIELQRYALDGEGQLTRGDPATGLDSYEVDFTATTGRESRWCWFARPTYGDRREADRKVLAYDSAPMAEDMELAGWPVLTLRMRAKTGDPAIFAYLEDVAPDGRVTYMTEGQLRAINRKLADPARLPYDQGPAPHSFSRADALPVVPGEDFSIKLKLYATAALIRKEHRIRLAIAGADCDMFVRLSNGEAERFDIFRGGAEPSAVALPLRPWR
ncbi:MAG: CocE/NonD family hydrolase [Proteobacteria bacterium]|nr:CocE/NonD family hydrolase [Pseudomonadota bacterium]